ncbi:hypothetical protein [Marinicella sp. W31]|uniref:hypothetical protein n=1 Tax=Marinicella sp. W31 TaxID=3023713 RepID=UPI0037575D64
MIWDSRPWKKPLLDNATWLRSIRLKETTRESTYVRIEKEIMISFYSIRKLFDTVKISDSTINQTYSIVWFKNINPVRYFNWHNVDNNFNLHEEHFETRDIRFICNRFIHSYIFLPVQDNNSKLDGFFVSTDHDKDKKLYFIELKVVLKIFRLVGRDYPSKIITIIDKKTNNEKHRVM